MIHIDPPPVELDDAVRLTLHHLELAATYFEALDPKWGKKLEDAIAKHTYDNIRLAGEGFLAGLRKFYDSIDPEETDETD